jgi:hypothetical protein
LTPRKLRSAGWGGKSQVAPVKPPEKLFLLVGSRGTAIAMAPWPIAFDLCLKGPSNRVLIIGAVFLEIVNANWGSFSLSMQPALQEKTEGYSDQIRPFRIGRTREAPKHAAQGHSRAAIFEPHLPNRDHLEVDHHAPAGSHAHAASRAHTVPA